jgi:hypothetical protein
LSAQTPPIALIAARGGADRPAGRRKRELSASTNTLVCRPIAAFGNSDGDLEMLQWTTMSGGTRFGLIVHHTDAEREYAYDRNVTMGRLDTALDGAAINKWTVVDMKRDWKVMFPFENR